MSAVASTDAPPQEARAGFVAAACAYALWGFLPLYLHFLTFADAREVLGQRILWCAPAAFVAVFAMSGWRQGWRDIANAIRPRMLGALALSAMFIFLNWWIYVWLVLNGRVIEASLAYFLAPLVSVAIGVVFFKERIAPAQIAALVLAGVGVAVQGLALGAAPWMALALCASWSMYALIRKRAAVPAATGLLVETVVLAPVAAALLLSISAPPAFSQGADRAVLLALAGPVTALPLMLFAFGARRVSFTALGLMQFTAPTLQFVLGLSFGEPFTPLRGLSFALIWAGLIFFSWDSLRRARAA
ncbi:MAG TPA: EamA family transporter RarD [Caulobacterales bacterium]|nr:EamA family transporter RarD [Caulobacterales bacterium]